MCLAGLEPAFLPVPHSDETLVPVFLSFQEDDNENSSEDDSGAADPSDDIKMDTLFTFSTKSTLSAAPNHSHLFYIKC